MAAYTPFKRRASAPAVPLLLPLMGCFDGGRLHELGLIAVLQDSPESPLNNLRQQYYHLLLTGWIRASLWLLLLQS